VRIGIYLDVRNPPPWHRPWAAVYRWTLELAEQAEAWGADSAWTTEHHFFEDGYLPQPLTLAAALAARTTRMRLGTAVLLAPLRPAVHIAEEAAVVDLISDGRLDLGLGAGYRTAEFEAYGADIEARYRTVDAHVRQIRALLGEGGVTPPPVQSPLQLWIGYLGPKGARRAGRMGEGLLSLVPGTTEPYLQGLAEAGHPPSTARIAGLVYALVADDPDEAWSVVGPHVAYQLHSYERHFLEGSSTPASPPAQPSELRTMGLASPHPGVFPAFVVVTPGQAVEMLRRYAPSGVRSEAFFFATIGGMPDELAARHVELLCTTVRPAVRDL